MFECNRDDPSLYLPSPLGNSEFPLSTFRYSKQQNTKEKRRDRSGTVKPWPNSDLSFSVQCSKNHSLSKTARCSAHSLAFNQRNVKRENANNNFRPAPLWRTAFMWLPLIISRLFIFEFARWPTHSARLFVCQFMLRLPATVSGCNWWCAPVMVHVRVDILMTKRGLERNNAGKKGTKK
jgi:hypothetical protein